MHDIVKVHLHAGFFKPALWLNKQKNTGDFWLNKQKTGFFGLLSQKSGLKSLHVNAP
jgi:hypothetical protein